LTQLPDVALIPPILFVMINNYLISGKARLIMCALSTVEKEFVKPTKVFSPSK